MGKAQELNAKLTAVADEVRELSGGNDLLGFDAMASGVQEANSEIALQEGLIEQAISALEGKVSPDLYEQGYADGYDAGVESVPDTLNQMLTNSLEEYSNEQVDEIVTGAFQGLTNLKRVHIPLLKALFGNTFDGCTGLTSVDFPLVTMIYGYVFRGCTNLKTINFPLLGYTQVASFQNCKALTVADFQNLSQIGTLAFDGCTALTTFVLRVAKVCTLQNTAAFTKTPIANGTGFIYVPDDLVEQYKVATNWSTYASQIKPLSELEV